ncbi:hypothetical protein C8R46DRAFT_656734 [Mycena filopes]|nr:hypothetical protein C8R46DRAFT_656734 [Mycena filopes]
MESLRAMRSSSPARRAFARARRDSRYVREPIVCCGDSLQMWFETSVFLRCNSDWPNQTPASSCLTPPCFLPPQPPCPRPKSSASRLTLPPCSPFIVRVCVPLSPRITRPPSGDGQLSPTRVPSVVAGSAGYQMGGACSGGFRRGPPSLRAQGATLVASGGVRTRRRTPYQLNSSRSRKPPPSGPVATSIFRVVSLERCLTWF